MPRPADTGSGRIAKRRSELGATLVETAIVLGLFFLFVLGVLDFGRGIAAYAAISHAAREGARAAIYYDTSSDADILTAVAAQTAAIPDLPLPGAVTISRTGPATSVGTLTKVQIDYDFYAVSPLIGQFFPGGKIHLVAAAESRVQ